MNAIHQKRIRMGTISVLTYGAKSENVVIVIVTYWYCGVVDFDVAHDDIDEDEDDADDIKGGDTMTMGGLLWISC
jgi:hypothetical protein